MNNLPSISYRERASALIFGDSRPPADWSGLKGTRNYPHLPLTGANISAYTRIMAGDLSACGSCLCLASRTTARAITRGFDQKLRPHGLRVTQFSVLVMLALRGPLPLGKLAGHLGLDRTTLTRSIAILEGKRWLASDAAEDARRRQIRITDAGRRRVETAFPAWRAAQESVQRKLGPAGASALQKFANELAA